MKYLTLLVLALASFTFAQEIIPGTNAPPPPPPPVFGARSRCFKGTYRTNQELIMDRVQCDFASGKSCETKIEQKSGFLTVNRQCTQTRSCMNNANGNNPKCYPGENNVRQCFFCCNTDLCNHFIEIPQQN